MFELKTGQLAPDFHLMDFEENPHKLSDFLGKWIVLYFYPRDNTPGCTTEAKDFTSRLNDFKASGAVVIGISPDKPASHEKFIQKHDLQILLLSDVDHAIIEKYGAWKLKKLYGREFMGVVRSTVLINAEGKIVQTWPKVKLKEHVNDVYQVLQDNL